jgi:hypothetical protein
MKHLTTKLGLRRVFRPKRVEVTESWRIRHVVELHRLSPSSNIIRVIKLKMMSLAGYMTLMGETRNAYNILVEYLKGGDHLEDTGTDWEENITMDL